MSDVPKIVRDRLRAGVAEGAHPEADLLTAFGEQALPAAEREGVLRHLAACRDCREIVALSIPPMEAVGEPRVAADELPPVPAAARRTAATPRNWFAWPSLRWAALAAGVVVVGSVLFLRPGKQSPAGMVNVERQTSDQSSPAATTAQPATVPPEDQRTSQASSEMAQVTKPDSASSGKAHPAKPSEYAELRREQPPALAKNLVGLVADGKRADSLETDKLAVKVPGAPAAAGRVSGGLASTEQVEVTSEQAAVTNQAVDTDTQAAAASGRLVARSEPPLPINEAAANKIEKAKPAAKEEKKQNEAASSEAVQVKGAYAVSDRAYAMRKTRSKDAAGQWSIAQGALRHSLDGGASWQTALQTDKPLLCFGERGSYVWAGGQAGTLFRSVDNGTTWTQVHPATKAESLAADIVVVEIRGPAEIVLTTNTGESWTTADGGKYWEKK
jgi:hypothetical protein